MVPSGEQHGIEYGDYAATITEVGATLRELRHRDRELVVPFGRAEIRPVSRGALLAPWPNRVADGRYTFGGRELQLALSEPARHNAIHGLVSWAGWRLADRAADWVALACRIFASAGYPFQLDLSVTYALGDDGLRTTLEATNSGDEAAPYGSAAHPYLVAGALPLDGWELELPAERYLEVTPDRLLPVEVRDVAGTPMDFQVPRPIAGAKLDHAYTGLARDGDGWATTTVRAPSGTGIVLRQDPACHWVQVHTADRPDPAQNRVGLAVEPMTCPPDAFRSGTDLVVLEAGATHRAEWTITAE